MSEQNRYRMEWNYKSKQGWSGWIDDVGYVTADA